MPSGAGQDDSSGTLDAVPRVRAVVQDHTLTSDGEPMGEIERVAQSSLQRDRHDRLTVRRHPADVVVTGDPDHDDVTEFRWSDVWPAEVAGDEHLLRQSGSGREALLVMTSQPDSMTGHGETRTIDQSAFGVLF